MKIREGMEEAGTRYRHAKQKFELGIQTRGNGRCKALTGTSIRAQTQQPARTHLEDVSHLNQQMSGGSVTPPEANGEVVSSIGGRLVSPTPTRI